MYQIKQKQFVKTDIKTCWDFFTSPHNLEKITPEKMGFVVLTEMPQKVYSGLIIAYKVRPVLGIPLNWVTEIKAVEENKLFVDEQRTGPYRMWHHEHHFEEVQGGVMMTDIVSYELPFGWLGKLAHSLFVRKQLKEIFAYRKIRVEELFGH